MQSKFKFIFLTLISIYVLTTTSLVAELNPYDMDKFEKDLKNKETIVLQFHASWCPTCRKQKKMLNKVLNNKDFSKFKTYVVDYDSEKDLKKKYKITQQSTMLLFIEGDKPKRSIGATRDKAIFEFLKAGL